MVFVMLGRILAKAQETTPYPPYPLCETPGLTGQLAGESLDVTALGRQGDKHQLSR
jgi:hypothetical protein